ncbi:MAG: hypothetical protein KAI47_04080, partial [Deltaproteobacteria bacterium]|nr:hypothetical protein [Deltaproteobacteria bacterium]
GFVLATRWNAALDAFMRFGRADDLERLSAQYSQSKRNEIRETDKHPGSYAAANVASRLGDAAKQFADDLAFGRLLNILKGEKKTGSAQHLINVLESEEIASFKDEFPPVLSTLSDLRSRLDPFVAATLHESDGLRASVRLAEYYGRIQRFAEQASLLWETLVSAIAPKLDLDLIEPGNKGSRVTREQASRALTALTQKLRKPETREEIPDKIFKEVELANQIGELRNDIEHCGLRDHPGRAKDLYKNLKTYMHKVSDLIVPMEPGKTRKAPSSEDTQPLPCFINLSNHPLIAWSDDQREGAEALGFGEPIDLEGGMPLVDPKATTEDIERLAHDLADKALRQGAQGAFVAGEFTLTQALVAILQSWSIHCYSATTEREAILEEKEDGSTERRSIFRFVAWREYPAI